MEEQNTMKAKLQTVIPLQSKIIHYDKRYRSFSHAAVYKATNQKFGKLVANALHLHDLSAMKPLLMSSHAFVDSLGHWAGNHNWDQNGCNKVLPTDTVP